MHASLLVFCFVFGFAAASQDAGAAADCRDWQDCREQALAAAARQDYESFHDLAWRAVQKGPKNDPALMTMLARAQSLSGRPHDALVMLQRLASMGVATDAGESDDFRRVRALPGWPDVERQLAELKTGSPGTPASAAAAAITSAKPTPPAASPANPAAAKTAALPPTASAPPAAAREPATPDKAAEEPAVGDAADALHFSSEPFTAASLAYDAVSDRFIVAHRKERRLSVIGERSSHMSNLIGANPAALARLRRLPSTRTRAICGWRAQAAITKAPCCTSCN
jgi:hypothetical protein